MGPAGPELHKGADPAKDQSYFLWATTAAQLDYLRFPLGGLSKPEVRREAERFGLAVAAKPDSQDICFVGGGDYAGIVEKLRPELATPGEIVDTRRPGDRQAQRHPPLHRRPAARASISAAHQSRCTSSPSMRRPTALSPARAPRWRWPGCGWRA